MVAERIDCRSVSVRRGLVFALAAPVLFAASQGVMPTMQSFSFGMVGLGSDEVARLNVVNIAPASGGVSCPVEAFFFDSQGASLKSARLQLEGQKAAFLELDRSEVAGSSGRLQIRAVYGFTVPSMPGVLASGSLCTIIPTLEIFNRDSGNTRLVLSDAKMVPLSAMPPGAGARR